MNNARKHFSNREKCGIHTMRLYQKGAGTMKKTIALLIAALMLVMLPAVPSAEENGTTVRVLLETQGE